MTDPPDITILYGSQTGNAEDMAKRIGLQAKWLGQTVLVEAMDDFPLKLLPKQRLVIFVCSTTGHGQEPENMKNIFNFMRRRDLPQDCLSNLRYVVYGLGDSSYTKFNYVSKILHKRLRHCGASPIQDLVAGDEQHAYGCDGIIYPKLDELWSNICNRSVDRFAQSESSYQVKLYSSGDGPNPSYQFREEFTSKYELKTATCVTNQRITHKTHFQDTRYLRFSFKETLNYEPGDVCTILPANSDENVGHFLELLNLNAEQKFAITKRDPNYMVNYLYDFIPDGLTIHDLVKYYLDIQSVPKRSFFEFLWPFSSDELERDKLKEFASTEGQEEVYEYCIRPKRSILEVLMDFPGTVKNIKFEYIFDLIPPIKPRSFSIASASSLYPNEIHLIVGVVKYKTRLHKPRQGLCSNYLACLEPFEGSSGIPGSKNQLRLFVRRTSFKLPKDKKIPVIMVGPGLGLAPFRSFIQDRLGHPGEEANNGNDNSLLLLLYFGCRNKDMDYYFKDELMEYERKALRLEVAFSRQQPKRYVQDLLLKDSAMIERLVRHENAHLYVAGNSKLPEDLRLVLAKILSCQLGHQGENTSGPGTEPKPDSCDELISELEASNRIQYDCW